MYSTQYRLIPVSVLDTTILEPGIGSIDTWCLVSPSPFIEPWQCLQMHVASIGNHVIDTNASLSAPANKGPCNLLKCT